MYKIYLNNDKQNDYVGIIRIYAVYVSIVVLQLKNKSTCNIFRKIEIKHETHH